MSDLPNLDAAAARSLAKWHAMVAAGDMGDLRAIVHPDAVFRSPVGHKDYLSADAVILAISTVLTVFRDFTYHREFVSADSHSVVLEFSALVCERSIKGADLIRFDADGLIVEFEVMVRPLSGLQALAEEMGRRIGASMPSFKASAST